MWEITGRFVDVVVTVPDAEAERLATDAAAVTSERVRDYLTGKVYAIAGAERCALIPPVETLSALNGFRKYDFTFKCDAAANLQIHFGAFFDLVPSHTNFAQVQNAATGDFTEQLLTNEHQTITVIGTEGGRLKNARFFEFVRMGMMHIFTGVDHMSFLLGLVLISRRLRDLVFVVTGFTIGHSLTLALAVTGVLRPHAEYIDALVALTIALIGAENIVVQTRRPKMVALVVG
ncbi:MAG TPA: HupE/UreJ family protein, partial [Steroidobacteraceae bacterium]